jgi:hypothetical protein
MPLDSLLHKEVRTGFFPRSGHMGFMIDKVTLGLVFSLYIGFLYQFSFRQLPYIKVIGKPSFVTTVQGVYFTYISTVSGHLQVERTIF